MLYYPTHVIRLSSKKLLGVKPSFGIQPHAVSLSRFHRPGLRRVFPVAGILRRSLSLHLLLIKIKTHSPEAVSFDLKLFHCGQSLVLHRWHESGLIVAHPALLKLQPQRAFRPGLSPFTRPSLSFTQQRSSKIKQSTTYVLSIGRYIYIFIMQPVTKSKMPYSGRRIQCACIVTTVLEPLSHDVFSRCRSDCFRSVFLL